MNKEHKLIASVLREASREAARGEWKSPESLMRVLTQRMADRLKISDKEFDKQAFIREIVVGH